MSPDEYEPEAGEQFPHTRYRCSCDYSAIVIGWEVEGVLCGECGSIMDWEEDVWLPQVRVDNGE